MKFLSFLIIALSLNVFSWDGERQGFLLGVGTGSSNNAFVNTGAESGDPLLYSSLSVATSSRIGYAFDNQKALLLYGLDISSTMGYLGFDYQIWNSDEIQANSWFGGVGILQDNLTSLIIKDQDPPDPNFGFGLNFGYSREIAKHTSIDLGIILGFISTEFVLSTEDQIYSGVSLTVNLMGY